MGGLLGEADPRIDHKRASADAGAACRYNTFLEFLGDLGNWILILRVLLHRRRGASKVPQNVLAVVASDRREHRPVGESARNIVDYACAGVERAARAVLACMVSIETVIPAWAMAATTKSTQAASTAGSTGCAPGRVDSPPTSMMSAPAARNSHACATRPTGVEELSTIAEGIWGDIQDANDYCSDPWNSDHARLSLLIEVGADGSLAVGRTSLRPGREWLASVLGLRVEFPRRTTEDSGCIESLGDVPLSVCFRFTVRGPA